MRRLGRRWSTREHDNSDSIPRDSSFGGIRPCAGNLFWLSNEQWERIKPHLPTDVRGVERAESSAASYMYSRAAVAVAIARPSTDRRQRSIIALCAGRGVASAKICSDLRVGRSTDT